MKKNTLNIVLIAGAAAAAYFIITAMRRRPKSIVEAGPTEKITAEQYEAAEVVDQDPGVKPVKPQAILDVIKTIKRSPAAKEAAKKRKALKKQPKAAAAIKSFLNMPKAVRGFDDYNVIY